MSGRVLIAAGANEALERRLLDVAAAAGLDVTARCPNADSLLVALERGADLVVASDYLHGLSVETLTQIRERRVPVVLVAARIERGGRFAALAQLVSAAADDEELGAACVTALERGASFTAPRRLTAPPVGQPAEAADGAAAGGGRVVALTSGAGGPGRTTVAIALAAALPQAVLVDADPRGGDVAPYLDLDARHGLSALTTTTASTVEKQLQAHRAGFDVLTGLEGSSASGLPPQLLTTVLGILRARYRWVVCDWGAFAEPLGALGAVDELVVVTGADMQALWKARQALRPMRELDTPLRLIINRTTRLAEYPPEIASVLRLDVLGVVPESVTAAHRSFRHHGPLPAESRKVRRAITAAAARLAAPRAAHDLAVPPARTAARLQRRPGGPE